ncbi:hypothetical protein DMC14_000165 [Metamycoplasma phocicerebrale]|uniref:Lipoprotein n=1 Tax=Metamycoplasma phocicerebrale TaxID=142649 RepID=A0A3T0TT37_9BACT|nr:hypothetical protein [Metamycoplasma phocicerebrale]AZZ65230.1 hypothetical protein DMC14_000165 [Metamycoplasma phocicerebrale]
MKKVSKLLIATASTSSVLFPLFAVSCTNYKNSLQNKINDAKQKSKLAVFVKDYKDKYLNEIVKAEKVLKDEKATKEDYKNTLLEFEKNIEKILEENKTTTEKYGEYYKEAINLYNDLKAFAAEELSEEKFNELKKQIVADYNAVWADLSKIEIHKFDEIKRKEFKTRIDNLLKKYKEAKQKIIDGN